MAQVIPLRPHTFRIDNILIDDFAAEIGALGVAVYAVLQRYADRTTGQCWPSVATIARLLRLSKNCVKKYLHFLARRGSLTSAPRTTAEGDPTSNLYTVHDPTQRAAVRRRQQALGEATVAGGGAPVALPSQETVPEMPQGGAPDGPKQNPPEQEIVTSVATPKIPELACNHPAHEHRSPVADWVVCLDCFRCWPVPPRADSLLDRAAPPLATVCSG